MSRSPGAPSTTPFTAAVIASLRFVTSVEIAADIADVEAEAAAAIASVLAVATFAVVARRAVSAIP